MSQQPPHRPGLAGRLRQLPCSGRCVLRVWLICVLSWCLSGAGALAAANPEYQVKAAFLYNFMKFVEWPNDGLSSPTTLTLGILGRDPFGDAIEEVRGKSAKGRRIAVQHLHGVEDARECDMVFVCSSEKGRLPQILKMLQGQRILTVADQEGFCQAGGMINLVSVKNRLAFEVNLAATTRARLRVSSQLLKLARIVLE